jgi:hypothetical protein
MRFAVFPTWMMSRRIDSPTMWSYTELMFSGLAELELRRIKGLVVDYFSADPARPWVVLNSSP